MGIKLDVMFLTQIGGILGPFAWVFGKVFNLLYELVSFIGFENGAVAITVVLFTIATKMLMMPLTVKQQKFSKLSNKMQPELTEIQNKYKNKKDEKSMRLSQMETQAVYEKYGTSPTAGCLPLLISLPIMFALYRVIYAIPAYVDDIYDLYNVIADGIKSMPDYFAYMSEVGAQVGVAVSKFDEVGESVLTNTHMIDIMTKFGTTQWDALMAQFPSLATAIDPIISNINAIHSVGTFNILNTPWSYRFSPALLIPVLAVATQLFQSFLTRTKTNKNTDKKSDNPMAQSMNSMMYIMPFMSGFFCLSFPICIGIYWVASTVVTIIQQFVINHHIDKMDLDEMIQKNVEKQNKRKKKMGIEQGTKMAELAKAQTKSITPTRGTTASYANATNKNYAADKAVEKTEEKKEGSEEQAPAPKSIAGYANMMKKNSDKGDK